MKKISNDIYKTSPKKRKCKKLCAKCIKKLKVISSTQTSFSWCRTSTEEFTFLDDQ